MADRDLIQEDVRREVGEMYFPFIDRGDLSADEDAWLRRAESFNIDTRRLEAERQRLIAEDQEWLPTNRAFATEARP